MNLSLVRKEVQEHWVAALLLGGACGILFVLHGLVALHHGLPPFTALNQYLWSAAPLGAWVLTGRLVRREFLGRTQLFLEALPISRLRMLTTKYVLGLVALFALAVPPYVVCAAATARGYNLTVGLLGIIATRTLVYLAFLHGVCFLLGLLGRYRSAILIVGGTALAGLSSFTEFDPGHAAPFALIDSTLPFERHDMPVEDLLWTAALVAVSAFASAGLASIREGSVAARLAHAMSNKEKALVAAAAISCLVAIFVWDEQRQKEPFDPPALTRVDANGVRFVVGAGCDVTMADARTLAISVHGRLARMREYLRMEDLEPIFLYTRKNLDASRYERGQLSDEEGVVVRVHYPSEGWSEDDFVTWLVTTSIGEYTEWRTVHEPRKWVVHGFGRLWAVTPDTDGSLGNDETLLLRALYGTPEGVCADDLRNWLSVTDRVGNDVAEAVAWSGLRVFGNRYGRAALRDFLADVLGRRTPRDVRALWHENSTPVPDLVERHATEGYAEFLDAWNKELDRHRARLADALRTLPHLTAKIEVETVSTSSRELLYTVRSTPPAPPDTRIRFEWTRVLPFDLVVDPFHLESHDVDFDAASQGQRLPESFSEGTLVGWRVAFTVDRLGCDVTSPFTRTELR